MFEHLNSRCSKQLYVSSAANSGHLISLSFLDGDIKEKLQGFYSL